MKRISFFLAVALLAVPAIVRAQDPATEERFNKLAQQIEVLIESRDAQNRKIEELARAIESLQQKVNRPGPSFASQEDVKLLADKLREVDRKRQEDNDRIIENLKREIAALIKQQPTRPTTSTPAPSNIPKEGYEYVIQQGDTLSVVIAAYREQGVKVTLEQIKKANPGIDVDRLRVGQKIFIPAQ